MGLFTALHLGLHLVLTVFLLPCPFSTPFTSLSSLLVLLLTCWCDQKHHSQGIRLGIPGDLALPRLGCCTCPFSYKCSRECPEMQKWRSSWVPLRPHRMTADQGQLAPPGGDCSSCLLVSRHRNQSGSHSSSSMGPLLWMGKQPALQDRNHKILRKVTGMISMTLLLALRLGSQSLLPAGDTTSHRGY